MSIRVAYRVASRATVSRAHKSQHHSRTEACARRAAPAVLTREHQRTPTRCNTNAAVRATRPYRSRSVIAQQPMLASNKADHGHRLDFASQSPRMIAKTLHCHSRADGTTGCPCRSTFSTASNTRVGTERAATSLESIRVAVEDMLQIGDPSIERVATRLACSPRSLRRQLSRQGCVFKRLLADVRCELACALLASSSLSVSDISRLLAYSEPAVFHRAFRRWKGVTPAAYRASRRLESATAQQEERTRPHLT